MEATLGSPDLVSSARAGDASALGLLLDPLWEPAYRLAFSILREREAAEDAVQESAMKAWRSVRKLRPQTQTVRPWFFTIVANQCRSMKRNRWWHVIRFADVPWSAYSDERGASDRRLDTAQALKRLSPDHRLSLVLRYYLDLPIEEVAQVLGISPTAAKSRIRRALLALEPVLRGTGEEQ